MSQDDRGDEDIAVCAYIWLSYASDRQLAPR